MACAHAFSVSPLTGGSAAAARVATSTAPAVTSTARTCEGARRRCAPIANFSDVTRRVKKMRWTAVMLASTASTQSAGSSTPKSAPAMRQIMRSGRSMKPTLHSTPIDSARAFV